MKIRASANQKGGVGKTTTVVCLGGLLAGAGHPTLLVDLDPHGSLTGYLGHDPAVVPGDAGTDPASIVSQSTRSAAPGMERQNSDETVFAAGKSSHGNGGCE